VKKVHLTNGYTSSSSDSITKSTDSSSAPRANSAEATHLPSGGFGNYQFIRVPAWFPQILLQVSLTQLLTIALPSPVVRIFHLGREMHSHFVPSSRLGGLEP
jgi:hypothetical protein